MSEKVCGASHPVEAVTCVIPARNPNHETHFANVGGEQYFWENPSFVEPQDKPSQAMRKIIGGHMDSLAAGVRKERSTVDRSSSTSSSTTVERLDGIEGAHGAMEEEFKTAAIGVAQELSRRLDRWTVDELWDELDSRQIFTDHPKGMTGLLRMMIGMGIIEPVPVGESDSHRSSRRTNASRTVQVYRSLLYEDVGATPRLIAFE